MSARESLLVRLGVPPLALRPLDDAPFAVAGRTDHYEILGEIARGGVGHVVRGRDIDLGRDVAIKVLQQRHAGDAELVRRFVEEAQIAGQLQHPGIIPVYELGLQADRRPYFVMRLVKGKTLAALLQEGGTDRRRPLAIFEQVCQTMAYAHSRGVIHRDLKPSNILVGAFGEVQVVDWGFAKVLRRGGIADEVRQVTQVATVRATGEGSVAGSVMGTPSYMAPEQAMGLVDQLDERTDVFSLGATLCEILTGAPPFESLTDAAQGRIAAAWQRLDACGADAALVQLAKACLAPARGARPRDATVLAGRISAHLAAVQERQRRAAVAAAEAKAEAARAHREATEQQTAAEQAQRAAEEAQRNAQEQLRARRQTRLLAASVLLALVAGGGGWLWREAAVVRQRAEAAHAAREAMAEAAGHEGEGRWDEAIKAAERAAELAALDLAGDEFHGQARTLVVVIRGRKERAEEAERQRARDEETAARVAGARLDWALRRDFDDFERTVAAALRDSGLDILEADVPTVAAGLTARGERGLDFARFLRLWALLAAGRRPEAHVQRLLAIADRADPDPEAVHAGRAALAGEVAALKALPGRGLVPLALARAGETAAAIEMLCAESRETPDAYWAHVELGGLLSSVGRWRDAVPYYAAAAARRKDLPGSWTLLGACRYRAGDLEEAIHALKWAQAKGPAPAAWLYLAMAHHRLGRADEAGAWLGKVEPAMIRGERLAGLYAEAKALLGQ